MLLSGAGTRKWWEFVFCEIKSIKAFSIGASFLMASRLDKDDIVDDAAAVVDIVIPRSKWPLVEGFDPSAFTSD